MTPRSFRYVPGALRGLAGRPLLGRAAGSLPDWLHGPLRYLLCPREPADVAAAADAIETRRRLLAAEAETAMPVLPSPAPGEEPGFVTAQLATLARTAGMHRYWGVFLRLLADALPARTVLELGSCTGISGAYLASSPGCRAFVGIEGSPALARVAATTIAAVAAGEAKVVDRTFAEALDELDALLPERAALALLDGQHEGTATRRYVAALTDHMGPDGVIVLDDIAWRKDMREAWEDVSALASVSLALDLGRLGVLLLGAPAGPRRFLDLAPYTRYWRPERGT